MMKKWIKIFHIITFFMLIISGWNVIVYAEARKQELQQPELLKPGNRSIVDKAKPIFTWKKIDDPWVEYRIRLAAWNGKIILDKWVGNKNFYQVTSPDLFTDLEIYLWSVSAHRANQTVQSETFSFCIDLNVSLDLEIINFSVLSKNNTWQSGDKVGFEIEILNCGPVPCRNAKVYLHNGNYNANYHSVSAYKKSEILDSTTVQNIDSGNSKRVLLHGKLYAGLNHFFAEVRPEVDFVDIFRNNNFREGPAIQTIDDRLHLSGLYVTYDTYADSRGEIHQLNSKDHSKIYENILAAHQFFFDHTQILQLKADSLNFNRTLTKNEFDYVDDKWGYILNQKQIEVDLQKSGVKENQYDFIYVFYPWINSSSYYSGYSGYTYKSVNTVLGQTAFAAQPVVKKESDFKEIIIHELLNIIDYFYEKAGTEKFYSPNDQRRYTTFIHHLDYCEWILETWPSVDWFQLGRGNKITKYKINYHDIYPIPDNLTLLQNYPNPFNSETIITFELPQNVHGNNHVQLSIYSIIGERVTTLVDDYRQGGRYSVKWNGINDSGEPVSTGIYFYKLQTGEQRTVKKLLLIK